MKKMLCFALGAVATAAFPAWAAPIVLFNSDFETGTLAGWTALGDASASATSSVTSFDGTTYVISAAGNYMAQLDSGGSNVSDIEAALGLALGSLNFYNANPDGGVLTNGAAIFQAFSGQVGDTLSFAWNYVATDYIPFNDPALALLVGPSNDFQVLASIQGLGIAVGDAGTSGWQTYNTTLDSAGTYTLAFVTFNDIDDGYNSYLHVDATAGTCTPDCPVTLEVPEPGSLPIVALGLGALACIGWKRRRERS